MTHLSDEAIAAFADDVLRGAARQRAARHCAECLECRHAVAVQREAIWALRAAPAPSLSTDLIARLRDVPSTTPISVAPSTVDRDGTMMFATFGVAAFVAPQADHGPDADGDRPRRARKPLAPLAFLAGHLRPGNRER